MFRLIPRKLNRSRIKYRRSLATQAAAAQNPELPEHADVVIIGGGTAGCNALYHLRKRGVDAILLDKSKLTSGTTWHTAGLVWSIRGPSDVEMELLKVTRQVLNSLENEVGVNPGWINKGGIYVAHSEERMAEYQRLVTASKAFGIDARMISPEEACNLFPLLDKNAFIGGVYSPADGSVDPAMLVNALMKSAKSHGAKVIEDCSVKKILTTCNDRGIKKVYGVETSQGVVKTNVVLNASGVWSRNIAKLVNVDIPLVPMKHAYVVTEPMEGLQDLPNVRDPDSDLYFRIRGGAISIGGYEPNPIILDSAPEQFSFSLYELDWNVFHTHMESMVRLIPKLSTVGIRSTVCGPESFTPDHRPILGEDPRCNGLYYSCGYNSAGMMMGGGFGEQIAQWIINGRPDKYMYAYDIRRFIPEQRNNAKWVKERSHEAYAKNYSVVFPHDESLSGRNLKTDPFHNLLLEEGAFMEQRQGWERPGWFHPTKRMATMPYDYGGYYGHTKNKNDLYREMLEKDYSFDFSPYDDIVRDEVLACRNAAALFDISYFGKFYLCGPEVDKAANYMFTSDMNREVDSTIYTCILNHSGGVEVDCTVSIMEPGSSGIVDPIFKDKALFIVSGGMSAYQTWAHISKIIDDQGFDVSLHDVTEQMGVLSIQGPHSRRILQQIADGDISEESFKFSTTKLVQIRGEPVRLLRLSFVGELGYELYIPRSSCYKVYNTLVECAKSYNTKLAGYRALYSLSCEKGYHAWGLDLRNDDNPLEAGLGFLCRKSGQYVGKEAVDHRRKNGLKRRLVNVYANSDIPMWGLETIYRDNCLVGYLRRAERGYALGNMVGRGYIENPSGDNVTNEFLKTGDYQIEIMGKRYPVTVSLQSLFDPTNKRLHGIYDDNVTS